MRICGLIAHEQKSSDNHRRIQRVLQDFSTLTCV